MVIGAFPVAKLGALLVRQISKPLANVVVANAKKHPFFRKYFIMPPANFYNWCEIQSKMWVLNLGKPISIPVLNENMAIELGANLLSEGIIFSIAAFLLLLEYNRQVRKEAYKEQTRLEELENIKFNIQELSFRTEQQDVEIKELRRLIYDKGPKNSPPPSPPSSPPSQDTAINSQQMRYELNKDLKPRWSKESNHQGLVLTALNYVERDVFASQHPKQRNNGIIFDGIEYLYCNSILISIN